jgi:polyisoprenoid-binding protein YceI
METVATEPKTTGQTWALDKAHAKIGFSITHMLVSEIEGSFKTFDVKLDVPNDDFSDASVEFTADVNSMDTQNEMRDGHLKKEDFFHADKFPTLNFKSTSFKKVDEKKYKLNGNLTMMGVTKPVELDVKGLVGKHPMNGKTIAGFKVTGTVKRSDFGMGSSFPSVALSNEVEINANAEFIKA